MGLSLPGLALDPARALSQYVHQAWGQEQGLMGGAIYALSRSPDGYLWIGTDGGLVRFDGTSFNLIQQPSASLPPIGRVRSLATDAQGTLWILLEGAHVLLYKDGRFSDAFDSFDLPRTTITAQSLDNDQKVLLAGLRNMVLRSANGKLEPIANAEAVPGTVTSMAQSLDRRIWIGTRDNGLFVSVHGRVSKVPHVFGDNKINALLADFNGGLWVGTDQGIYFLSPQGDLVDPLPEWTHRHPIRTMFRDPLACVWAGTDNGLIRISPAGQASFRRSTGDGEVNAVFQDREGNLWFGGTGGLERLQDGVFSTFSTAEGVPAAPMGPIFADDDGGVWFAPLSGGLYWYRGGRLHHVRQDGLGRDVVYSIHGRGADVWVGRQRGGLTHIRRSGENILTRTFTEKDGLAQDSVYAVHMSPNGTVWAGTINAGISVLRGSRFRTYTTTDGLSSNAVTSITEGQDGRVWAATPNGIDEFHGDRWTNWTVENGLPSSDVRLCFADSHGLTWAATSDGLSYLSGGHITTLHHLHNLIRKQILGIAEDHLGFLWLLTSDHLLRANRNALLADSVQMKDLQRYGVSDGLSGIQVLRRERSLVADATGRIWISLGHGIASGEPSLTERDSTPIQVRISSVSANSKNVDFREQSIVPAGTRSMAFQYSSDSLFAPERARFRYRLEGAEADWSDAVGWRQASYNNLGPGNYRFHVIASRDGVLWNGPETVYAFSVAPTYWQTSWFRTAGAIAILLSVLLIIRLRSIRVARQLNARFQERLSERMRIARDLHDTLLQSFQGSLFEFQAARNLLSRRPEDAMRTLDDAISSAEAAIAEGRNAIQDLRSAPQGRSDFTHLLTAAGQELSNAQASNGNGASFRVTVEGPRRTLSPILQDEIYRIGREVLRNAFRHARARRIEVEIRYDDRMFRLRIRDDGIGIEPRVLEQGARPGHWGLPGVRERAKLVGAQLDFWSEAGAGTEVQVRVPAAVAYAKPREASTFRLFRKTTKSHAD